MVPMKKLLSIALALVLCLALCVPAFAATPDLGSFTDKIEEIKASLGDFDTAKITEALGNIDLDSIKDALSGSGIDLSEIAGLLGGGDFDLGAIKDQVDISAVHCSSYLSVWQVVILSTAVALSNLTLV